MEKLPSYTTTSLDNYGWVYIKPVDNNPANLFEINAVKCTTEWDAVDDSWPTNRLEVISYESPKQGDMVVMPDIERVIFSGQCTIVIWSDGTKTMVRASDDDPFDYEKGMAMAISKKALGNKGKYFDTFKKWMPKEKACSKRVTQVDRKTGKKWACDFKGKRLGSCPYGEE